MTDLWYIKPNYFLRFETLKSPEILVKFTKNCPEISLLPAGTAVVVVISVYGGAVMIACVMYWLLT